MTDTKQDFLYPTVWVAYKPKDEQHTDHHRVKQILRCEEAIDYIERKHELEQLHGDKIELEVLRDYLDEFEPTDGYHEYSLLEQLDQHIDLIRNELNNPSQGMREFAEKLEEIQTKIVENDLEEEGGACA